MPCLNLDEMSWQQVRDHLPDIKLAIIPTGSSEQHGPHLPQQVDTICAVEVATRVGEGLYPKALVTTPISFGVSYHHMGFPGTLTIREETLVSIICDFCWSLKHHGISEVLVINGHKGNMNALGVATRKATDEIGVMCLSVEYWDYVSKEARDVLEDGIVPGHGSEFETSIVMSSKKPLAGNLRSREHRPDKAYSEMYFRPRTYLSMKKLFESSPDGMTLGDPSKASGEKGTKLVHSAVEGIIALARREFSL